jgi:hypothetical protein
MRTRGEWPKRRHRSPVEGDGTASTPAVPGPTVLVVGTDDWAIDQAAEALADAGSPVLRCHEPGAPAFPCNALVEGRTCPLDIGFDVVATVRARAGGAPAQSEFGVVCGVRAGVPLVVAGLAADRPFGSWAAATVEQGGDLVSTCRAVAEQCAVDQAIATHHVPEGAHS